jgi:DNA (cytosine-5)-methyltransferase 1
MVNHPNRSSRAVGAVIPTPDEVLAARQAAGLTQTQAAELVHSKLRAWQCWEAKEGTAEHRRMHPGLWELFRIKTGQIKVNINVIST